MKLKDLKEISLNKEDIERIDRDHANRVHIIRELLDERVRQDEKWGEQNHPNGTGHPPFRVKAVGAQYDCEKATKERRVTYRHILLEEVFEALAESDPAKLRAELVQVAAVTVQWIEAIDRGAHK